MPSSDEDLELSPAAELFAQYVERVESGAPEDFEGLCERHPEHAPELRRMYAGLRLLGGALEDELAPPPSEPAARDLVKLLEGLRGESSGSARLEVRREVARGGRGRILEVFDRDLGRELAMKTLRVDGTALQLAHSESRAVARFLDEARVTGGLEHPGIVPVHELGLDAEGRLFFTMPLIRGEDFGAVIRRVASGEWKLARAIGILLRVCEAVSFAHSRGVVHRDLKPSNVMVGPFGETYVIDWGLARFERERSSGSAREEEEPAGDSTPLQTMVGDVLGTPAYMAPEQARGELAAVGPRSDVYSIGAMLYELLCGEAPYRAGDSTPAEVVRQVRERRPERLVDLAPDAPAELVAICERAMQREPADRYASMEDLAEDLRAFGELRVVKAYETGAYAELRKWVRRNRGLASAFALSAAALAIGSIVSTALYWLARDRQRDVFRLSAIQDVRALFAEADELWPISIERVPAMEDWTGRAANLVASLPEHRARFEALEGSEPRTPEGWWREQLGLLIGELESLEADLLDPDGTSERGIGVTRRIELASEFHERSLASESARSRWAQAAAVARERYDGLELEPRFGLLPIGSDPRTGLLEFYVLGSGEEPQRDASGTIDLRDDTGIVLVLLPALRGLVGAQAEDPTGLGFYPDATPIEGPPEEISVDPFFLGKYEVTQAQWLALRGSNPSQRAAGSSMADGGKSSLQHPVESVSWLDAAAFAARLGLSLPTEVQWELACRAGTTTPWFSGSDVQSLQGFANLADEGSREFWSVGWDFVAGVTDGYDTVAPIGRLRPNPLGLHDMVGNVMEWVRDGSANYASFPARAGDGLRREGAGHTSAIYRGGDFFSVEHSTRSSYRGYAPLDYFADSLGLRVAGRLEP